MFFLLLLFFIDSDGDQITIFNALDFAIFQEQKINKVFVSVKDAVIPAPAAKVVWESLNSSNGWGPKISMTATPVSCARARAGPTTVPPTMPPSASADDIRNLYHEGVICDACDKEIRGYRYKCLECPDYDLCMVCEPNNHKQHLLLRIANPNDADICYRTKLGKRFIRHRRSESLCSKPDDRKGHDKKGHHHKRHTSGAIPLADMFKDLLNSAVNYAPADNVSAAAAAAGNAETANQDQSNGNHGQKSAASSAKTPTAPPVGDAWKKERCVQFKSGIDTLSNIAQNFAAMMDPFNTYIQEAAEAANASATAAATAAAAATVAANSAPSAEKAAADANVEPMDGIDSEKEKQTAPVPSDVMIIDCADDDDDDSRFAAKQSRPILPDANQANRSTEGSPSRGEWTFVSATEVDDQASTSAKNTGTVPKKTTPSSNNVPTAAETVDFAELSRLLSTHIEAERKTPSVQGEAASMKEVQVDAPVSVSSGQKEPAQNPTPMESHPIHEFGKLFKEKIMDRGLSKWLDLTNLFLFFNLQLHILLKLWPP